MKDTPDVVVLHCFSGDADFARAASERGWYLSFSESSPLRMPPNCERPRLLFPEERLLVETDAPFLTPAPFRGKPNAPYLVPLTVRGLCGSPRPRRCAVVSDLYANSREHSVHCD